METFQDGSTVGVRLQPGKPYPEKSATATQQATIVSATKDDVFYTLAPNANLAGDPQAVAADPASFKGAAPANTKTLTSDDGATFYHSDIVTFIQAFGS